MDKDMIVRALLIVAACAILYWLVSNYHSKQSTLKAEKFYQEKLGELGSAVTELPYFGEDPTKAASVAQVSSVMPSEEHDNSAFRAIEYDTKKVASDCFPKDRLTAADLLPKDAANSKWAQVNPAGQGELQGQNFLTAGFQVGVNTVGSSLRNANLQLRSEPPVAKGNWGPIYNSTIEPDVMRRPLEIGGDF
jgi:hypothetical protein